MEAKQFEVEVVYQQRTRYLVEAADEEEAERLALDQWQSDEEEDLLYDEDREEVVAVSAIEIQDAQGAEDRATVLRFLRDRELVIETLDRDLFNPTVHDAVSAEDVARHLEWIRPDASDTPTPDAPRAARALEALCRDQQVVCFTRPRVRRGERGEMRLYCTPQHLERLTTLLVEGEPELAQAVQESQEAGAEAG